MFITITIVISVVLITMIGTVYGIKKCVLLNKKSLCKLYFF